MTLRTSHVGVQVLPYAGIRKLGMTRTVLLALALTAVASAALAQEAMSTRSTDIAAPPPAAPVTGLDEPTQNQAQAAEWARQVLARANGQLPPTDERALEMAEAGQTPGKNGCVRNPDRSPHGEVSAAVGSRGYRGVSGVVTQPIGDCGQITIGISTSRGGGYYGGYGGGYGRGWR
jgi:hypothetical protein